MDALALAQRIIYASPIYGLRDALNRDLPLNGTQLSVPSISTCIVHYFLFGTLFGNGELRFYIIHYLVQIFK